MSLVASTQVPSRPDERRRNPRHSVSTIIYVHLGTDNGGIVINLGSGGVAFQAAMRLTAKKDSTLDVRLRGSGLDVQLVGEIVWLGATQKEAGICFKDPSTKQQQDIANWITRQQQPLATVSYGERPWQELPPAIPFPPAAPENFGSHSLAAALGMSRTVDPPPSINPDADADDSIVSALLNPDGGLSAAESRLEIVPLSPEGRASVSEVVEHSQRSSASLPVTPSQFGAESHLPAAPIEEIFPSEPVEEKSAENAPDKIDVHAAVSAAPLALRDSATQAPSERTLSQPEQTKLIPKEHSSNSLKRSAVASASERWVPPALLAIWREGTPQHRAVLAAACVACVGFFALLLILAVARVDNSLGRTTASEVPLHPTPPPAPLALPVPGASTVRFDPNPAAPAQQAEPTPIAPVPRRTPRLQTQPSALANLAKTLFGYNPDKPDANSIDDEQLRVQVWTSRANGYYYCTDDPYYKSIEPGEFMSQGDALQNGYRSILGQFCN